MNINQEDTRFVLLNDEGQEIGEMTFKPLGEDRVAIDHTFVDPTYRGQNLAAKLLQAGVNRARQEHKKIVPVCPYVKRVFEAAPDEYADVQA